MIPEGKYRKKDRGKRKIVHVDFIFQERKEFKI